MPDPVDIAVAIPMVVPSPPSAAGRLDVIGKLRLGSTTYLVPPLVVLISWAFLGGCRGGRLWSGARCARPR